MAAFPRIHRVVESICAAIERSTGAFLIRRREPTCLYEVECLEERRLLSLYNISWDQWEHSSPAFFASVAAAEQQYPRFATLVNADLAALQAESASGAAVAAESAVLRGGLHHPRAHARHPRPAHHPKPLRHPRPAHNVKPHRPKPHRHGYSVTEALSPSGGPSVTANNFVYDPSLPHQLIFTFNEDVSGSLSSAGMSAISVVDLATGSSVTPTSYNWTASTDTATYGFSSALPDGNYAAVLHGSLIYDSSNVHLIGSDGTNGHDYLATSSSDNGLFWFKDADPNRDRSVGNDDTSLIAAHYNMPGGYKQGDVDYSGTVNFNDLVIVDRAFGQSVPLLGAPGTPTLTAAGTDRLLISWPASTDTTVTGYDVYRNWQRVATNVPTASFMDTGLTANTSYTYSVVAKNANGNTSFATVPLVASTAPVGALTVQPVANQNMNAGGTLTFSTTFSDTGPAATHSATVRWGDGNTTSVNVSESNNSGTISGSHTYAGPGPYYGALTVQGTNGESATTIFPVAAYYDAGGGYTVGQAFTLSPVFIDPGGQGSASGYTLSWGDGSGSQNFPGSATSFTHVYSSEASSGYTATVTATTSDGTYTDTPVINEAAPTLSLSGGASVNEQSAYTLTASVTDGDTGDTYTWDIGWGDGSGDQTFTAPAGSFVYVYAEPGTYSITALVSEGDDSAGQGALGSATVSVSEVNPVYSVTASSSSVTEGTDLTLTESFSDPGGDSLDNLSVAWGDGNIDVYSILPHATYDHTYAEAGTYSATSVFSTEDGLYSVTTTISASDATPNFSVSTPGTLSAGGTCLLQGAFFDPGSNDTPSQWTIVWGDGNTDTFGANPDYRGAFTHTYSEPSTGSGYSITATVVTDDSTYTAMASQPVVEAISTLNLSGLHGAIGGQAYTLQAFFTDPANDPATGYVVDWNDGTTQTYSGPILTHVYPTMYEFSTFAPTVTVATDDSTTAAVSTVTLQVDSPGGQGGSLSVSANSPLAEGADYDLNATFSDPVQVSNGFPAGAQWTVCWGDGSLSGAGSLSSPVPSISLPHVYAEAGTYQATIGAEYEDGSDPNDLTAIYEVKAVRTVIVNEVTPTLTVSSNGTATVTGDAYALMPTFTDPGSHDMPQKTTISWGDGATQIFFGPGVPATLTHLYTTASTSGTVYSPGVSVVTDDGTYSATTSVTVGQPIMNVIQGDGTAMNHDDQHGMGAFVVLNNDDDGGNYDGSGNPIPDLSYTTSQSYADPELLQVSLQPLPASVGGTYSLSWNTSDCRVWADPYKSSQLASGATFSATAARSVYLEAIAVPQTNTDTLEEDWHGGPGAVQVAAKVDNAGLKTITVRGPQNVPAYGIYSYTASGPVPEGVSADSWSITNGSVTGNNPKADRTNVQWTMQNAGTAGWVGKVDFVIGEKFGQFKITPRSVNVVNIVVTTPNNAFTNGTPKDGGFYNHNGILTKKVLSADPNAAPPQNVGLGWKAAVTLNGPHNPSVSRIEVGFVQNVTGFTNNGDKYTYVGKKTGHAVSTLNRQNAATLDQAPIGGMRPNAQYANVWYSNVVNGFYTSVFLASNPQNNTASVTLNSDDTPFDGPPTLVLRQFRLVHMTLEFDFELDVCAQTQDPANGANQVYVKQSSVNWSFNGSGTTDPQQNFPWTGDQGIAKVTPPTAWSAQIQTGATPGITKLNFNQEIDGGEAFT